MGEKMKFWEALDFAIKKAYDDGRYLDDPRSQELVVWHDVTYGKKGTCLIKFRASWLKKEDTIVYDERNFERGF